MRNILRNEASTRHANATSAAMKRAATPCRACGRRQIWTRHFIPDVGVFRVCRYCKEEIHSLMHTEAQR